MTTNDINSSLKRPSFFLHITYFALVGNTLTIIVPQTHPHSSVDAKVVKVRCNDADVTMLGINVLGFPDTRAPCVS